MSDIKFKSVVVLLNSDSNSCNLFLKIGYRKKYAPLKAIDFCDAYR